MIQWLVQFDKICFQPLLSEIPGVSKRGTQFEITMPLKLGPSLQTTLCIGQVTQGSRSKVPITQDALVALQNIQPVAREGTVDAWLCWKVPQVL